VRMKSRYLISGVLKCMSRKPTVDLL